jgi:hypothetical protein
MPLLSVRADSQQRTAAMELPVLVSVTVARAHGEQFISNSVEPKETESVKNVRGFPCL